MEVFVQRYWIDGTKIGNFFKLRQILVCFVLCSDAKRQWGQSPEIEDSTESKDDPTSPRYAMSGFHITMDDTAATIYVRQSDELLPLLMNVQVKVSRLSRGFHSYH